MSRMSAMKAPAGMPEAERQAVQAALRHQPSDSVAEIRRAAEVQAALTGNRRAEILADMAQAEVARRWEARFAS